MIDLSIDLSPTVLDKVTRTFHFLNPILFYYYWSFVLSILGSFLFLLPPVEFFL